MEHYLAQSASDLDILKNRVGEKQLDLKKYEGENNRLKDELKLLLDSLDDEKFNCLKLRNENQTLEEQIPFLNAIHEQEMAEMRQLNEGPKMDPTQYYRQELERAIRDIRNDFEQLNEIEKRDLEAWQKAKTEEIKEIVAKKGDGRENLPQILLTNKDLKEVLNQNNNELKDLDQQKKKLEKNLYNLEENLKDLRRKNADTLEDREKEYEVNTMRRLIDHCKPPSSNDLSRDELMNRLEREKAKLGDAHVSIAWDNVNDLDLHLIEPSGEEICFSHRKSASGGELDVDMNSGSQRNDKPCENIFWSNNTAPRGHYKVIVVHYSNHGAQDPTNYLVSAELHGKSFEYRGKITYGNRPDIWEFDI